MSEIDLKIKSVIGFSGNVARGLTYTPCGKYIIYPLGSFVVIKNLKTDKESFLDGHSYEVSCLSVSSDGRRVASGQVNFQGVKADVIVWDLEAAKSYCDAGRVMIGNGCLIHRLRQHLGKVQDVSFSSNCEYLCTAGGRDDNAIVVWRVDDGVALCGSPAAADSVVCIKWLNNRDDRIVSAGYYHVKVWQIDFRLPKLNPMDAKLGQLRRVVETLCISECDHFAYCGTATGDVIKVKIDRNDVSSPNDPDTTTPVMMGLSKDRVSKGIKTMVCVPNPSTGNVNILVGAGDGGIVYMNNQLNIVKSTKTEVLGGLTSLSLSPNGKTVAAGTDLCNRYELSVDLTRCELKMSCHCGTVNDIAFPEGCPDLVVTSSTGDIRVWNVRVNQEMLRIQVPNLDCLCCKVSPTGTAIISGWNDGKIRAFLPESGRMKFVIPDAHSEKVTALALCDNDAHSPWRIISGGAEGKVRVWNVHSSHQTLVASLKEHRGAVNCISVNADCTQCISASADGSCIVWDLERYVRIVAFFEPNVFANVQYHPDESQMLTCGSNHKITYWDATDGQAIRVIDGSDDIMTCLDIEPNGEFFISGGEDKQVKIWHYDDGITVAVGDGHCGGVKAIKISPNLKHIVSVGGSGEIIFWEFPEFSRLRRTIDEIMGDAHHK